MRARWPDALPPLRLVLVGRDEGAEATLRERIAREKLADFVLLTGEVDDAELRAGTPAPTSSRSSPATRPSAWSTWRRWPRPARRHPRGWRDRRARHPGQGAIVVPPFDAPVAESAVFDFDGTPRDL
ncbi:MAG: hypothetical protein U0232_21420 [Thermomicrobiales bacterium]